MDTSLKLLAKRARGRLQTAAKVTSEPASSSVALNASGNYMVVASIRSIEDDPLFAKVKRLIEREQNEVILNPIAQLIDKSSFSTMTESQRERYVLKLTKRYNEIHNYILNN